jgi:N-methylhydantoinase B/oxoprolinase/acetone carboxylase alpha subunit
MQHDDLTAKIEDYKTDENELEELIEQYDLDATLEAQFNSLDKRFKQLEIKYQSLLNARRFLING